VSEVDKSNISGGGATRIRFAGKRGPLIKSIESRRGGRGASKHLLRQVFRWRPPRRQLWGICKLGQGRCCQIPQFRKH